MCGIAGAYNRNGGRVSRALVEGIGSSMDHRGPDNFGVVEMDKICFSHNRLSLLDLSAAANQPFKNDDYVLVYNGEIYNFREIGRRLVREYGVEFRTSSDTEVLFYSLIHEGIHRSLEQIRGMFAFAFYDKSKDELFLARDRLGIKPLYYNERNGLFCWSSEIKALAKSMRLGLDPVRTLFSINGIAEKSGEYTMFEKVVPVKPGTWVKVSAKSDGIESHTYYKPIDDFDPDLYRELDALPRSAVLDMFEGILVDSIRSVLVSDAPLGAFVSGGIDSGLISSVAREFYPDLKLFTSDVVGPNSEIEDARALADHLGLELFPHQFRPEMMLSDWAEVTYAYECPLVIHANAMPFANVARLAREAKVKAVLTGEGADELFLGYPRLLTRRYEGLAKAPIDSAMALYRIVPGLKDYLFPNPKARVVDFVNQLVQGFEKPRFSDVRSEKLSFLSDSKRKEQYQTLDMLSDHLVTLLHRNDRMGMMSSIEARFPFLDERLVKFAISLPARFKIGRSVRLHNYKHPFLVDKWIVRKTAKNYLPERIVSKKKMGFPMTGLKAVRIKPGFFKGGWISETLSLTGEKLAFLVETQDPYFVGKLASVDVFGRVYGHGESISRVKKHILENASLPA